MTSSTINNDDHIDLKKLHDKDVDYFSFQGKYIAKITNVYDGDTCHAIIPFGGKFTKIHVRMLGYNTPEIKDHDLEKKNQAKLAKELFSSLVLDKIVTLDCGEFDKYGRVLGKIQVGDIHVNDLMIQKYGKYMI